MHIIIVGNGILGLMTAYQLLQRDSKIKITIVGPSDQRGCASLAAAAMFNSFAEIDTHTLQNQFENQKFLFNRAAAPLWPSLLKEISAAAVTRLEYGFGTYVINNHVSDSLEDHNFDAIIAALQKFDEKYEIINPAMIPGYKPVSSARAGRAIYIPNEGWVNPIILIAALKKILASSKRVNFVDGYAQSLQKENHKISHVLLDNKETYSGDIYLLTPGATFTKIINNSNLELHFPKIFYGVGCSILLKTENETLQNCIRTPNRGLACGIYCAPQDSEHTLVGASNFITANQNEINHVRLTSVYTLIKAAMEQINTNFYRSELVKVNIGWRPTSEDTLPLLGPTSLSNLFVATGTKRDGLHCSPLISKYFADLIIDGESDQDLSLFQPERQPIRIYSRQAAIEISVRHIINAAYQHDFVPAKNRMVEELEKYYYQDLSNLHDQVGAHNWGIPPEMINMYRYGHIG